MHIIASEIADVKIIELKKHADDRGFFIEKFRANIWAEHGLPELKQINHSRSNPKVLRGLHAQKNPSQGKLIGVASGKIFDVAVDVRVGSETYLQHITIELDESKMLWIPPGFLHGFCVIGDFPADVFYQTSEYYNGAGEFGVRYDDVDLAIKWPYEDVVLSERDKNLPYWGD